MKIVGLELEARKGSEWFAPLLLQKENLHFLKDMKLHENKHLFYIFTIYTLE